jgi:hypothetical protein
MVYVHNGVLVGHKEQNHVICRKINGNRDHYVKQKKSGSERKLLHIFSLMEARILKK